MKTKLIASIVLVLALFSLNARADEKPVQKWEYAFYSTNIDDPKPYSWNSPEGRLHTDDFEELVKFLHVPPITGPQRHDFAAIGACGWELVAVHQLPKGNFIQYIFKRPVR
jgi:hypothetical protein